MRLGCLRNRVSTLNRGRPAPALPEGTALAETDGPGDCAGALARLAADGAEAVVIDGGDGTVRAALTHLHAAFGRSPPVAILPNGNTNLVARRLGAIGPDDLARLARLSAAEGARRARPLPAMRLDFADARAPLLGFIAGWGAYAAGTRMAGDAGRARHGAQVIATVLATLGRSVAGGRAAELRRGIGCGVAAEGHALPEGRRFLGIVTVLPGRLLGPLSPFWGGGGGALRFLDVTAPPRRLALAAPFAAAGRPLGWMEGAGYRSGRTSRLSLALGPGATLVVDGEVLDAAEGLEIVVTAGEPGTLLTGAALREGTGR